MNLSFGDEKIEEVLRLWSRMIWLYETLWICYGLVISHPRHRPCLTGPLYQPSYDIRRFWIVWDSANLQ